MKTKFNIIAAACEDLGIGKNNTLPWKLKTEMAHFTRMTTNCSPGKMNAVVMGRKTWDSVPIKYKPFKDRINVVISSKLKDYDHEYVSFVQSLEDAMKVINEKYQEKVDDVWIIGGSHVYNDALKSDKCHRIYLTKIYEKYDCDVFFPKMDDSFVETRDSRVAEGIQEENGVKYEIKVYEKTKQ